MQHRFARPVRAGAAIIFAVFLSACGGGGGGSSSSIPGTATGPALTSTPAPGTLNVPGQQSSGGGAGGFANDGTTLSAYTVTSNPSGQAFSLAGQSYVTPKTLSPSASSSVLSIVFASNYTVPIVQVKDGPHSVYYNAAADSTGTVALASLQSIRRRTASVAKHTAARIVHRSFRIANTGASDVDPTHVAVRMSAAALRTSGRSAQDVERSAGGAGRSTLSATADLLRVVAVPAGIDVATFTRTLQAHSEVLEVTPVHRRHLLSRAPTALSDPGFQIPDQWYSFATGANYAWSYNAGIGAKIAIIDTGIDDKNTDLTSQLVFEETAVTPIDNAGSGASCFPQTGAATQVTLNTARDDNGHGTDVTGIAIAAANSAGFAGAAWGAKLMAFKIYPDQNASCNNNSPNFGANSADEAQAIADAVTQGADVISLSLGAPAYDQVEFNAVESAIAAGVTVVAAAGNGELSLSPGILDYPAAYPGVISVGASALKDEYYSTQYPPQVGTYASANEIVASYSQYGPSLNVVAPGGDALHFDPNACAASSSQCDNDLLHWIENYSTSTEFDKSQECSTPSPATSCVSLFNGTSMATPQVSATAAMLIAEAGGHKSLTPAQISYIIDSTADNINDAKQGHGRLNAYRALASLIRDTGAYSGPVPQKAGSAQLVAFAYKTGNTNKPAIIDASFPAGVPVSTDGTGSFRIADVPAATGTYGVAVWYDANGDGVIDAGDQIGTAATKCSSTTPCAIGTITLTAVQAGYYLP